MCGFQLLNLRCTNRHALGEMMKNVTVCSYYQPLVELGTGPFNCLMQVRHKIVAKADRNF